ncbi:MAG: thiamine ABC transporter substrate-binding protein [Anaerolineae bacterium]|nr:thiamine ABC transporter substrate-binding protein [Anaerolineae bacterium]
MKALSRLLLVFVFLVCVSSLIVAQDEPITLTVLTHDSFNVSEDVLAAFQEETGIEVEILRGGDAGQIVNQSVLTAGNPLADVLYGIDNTFLSRALDAGIFLPYESSLLGTVDSRFLSEAVDYVTPVDYGDVCINYDVAYFEENELAVPQSLAELTAPEYEGLLVAQNPATSSPGLAFLVATVSEFGEDGDYTYLDYWSDLVGNDTLIADSWSDAYFTYFTAGSEDGTYPMVVSYASSPPFTVDEETETASTESIVADGMCFRQIEYVGILTGTEKVQAAQQFVNFMLSESFQADLPLQMYVFPVVEDIELPELFAEYAQIPENPVIVDPALIEENRENWIQSWTETVLR